MIGLEQVDSFRLVARQAHAIGPLPFRCPILVHGDEAMRGQNGIPELVALRVVLGAVFCIPPKSIPRSIEGYRVLDCYS